MLLMPMNGVKILKPLSPWITIPVIVVVAAILIWREKQRPLRKNTEPNSTRQPRNIAVAGFAAVAAIAVETPLVQPLTFLVERVGLGLLGIFRLPLWGEVAASLVLMDYTFYVWHVLMHRVPFLWRFHAVHHLDLDMDASTAFRFHFGEILLSIPWRATQVLAIGMTPFTFSIWQLAFSLCVLFHHSNVELPYNMERLINRILVTPRMHGIHHSVIQRENNSNWSSGLTLWDWLHGTLRLNVYQRSITIGVPALHTPDDVTIGKLLAMPFRRQPRYWPISEPDGSPGPHEIGNPTQMLP